jgi:hypothetical protein
LTGYGDEWVVDGKPVGERNDSGNSEDNDARLGGGECFAQTAGTAIGECGHFVNFSASAAGSNCARAFGARKGGDFWRRAAAGRGSGRSPKSKGESPKCEESSKFEVRSSKQVRKSKFEYES